VSIVRPARSDLFYYINPLFLIVGVSAGKLISRRDFVRVQSHSN